MSSSDPRAEHNGHTVSSVTARHQALTVHRPGALRVTGEYPDDRQVEPDSSLHLLDIVRIIVKHKGVLIAVLLLSVAVSILATFLMTPSYRATAVIQIDKSAAKIVEFNKEVDVNDSSLDDRVFLATQYELLKSRSLSERVVDELRLDQGVATVGSLTAELPVLQGGKSSESEAIGADAIKQPGADTNGFSVAIAEVWDRVKAGYKSLLNPATQNEEVLSKEVVVTAFAKALTIDPLRNSRLVKVHVENTDPELAAKIANTTVQTYISMNLERRFEASSYAKAFLGEQLKQTKAKLEESERRLNDYSKAQQILSLDEKTNVINQTFTEFSSALAKAEQERIKAESMYQALRRDPSSVSQVLESKLIQTFKEQKAKLDAEYQENLKVFKPAFPKMLQIKSQMDEIDSKINAEIKSIEVSVRAQFESARQQEASIRARLNETRREVVDSQAKSIDLNLFKREVDTNRQLYDGLLQRLKEVGVAGGVGTNNISIVDKAQAPLFPYRPSPKMNAAIGLAIGLFLGLALVFLLEYLDDSIKFPDEVERLLGLAMLGVIPAIKKHAELSSVAMLIHLDPRSAFAEAYRSVRTALQFSTSDGAPRRLTITSCGKNEGKSTTSLSLAMNFAQLGRKTLLIDADMRNPSVHKLLSFPNDAGLSNFLAGEGSYESLVSPTSFANLMVITGGPTPPNPVDLLTGSRLLGLLEQAEMAGVEYIIIDSPPVLGLADAIVLGNQIQNTLFVVESNKTRKAHIKDALRRLRMSGVVPKGIVLTKTTQMSSLYGYDSYYGSYYGYGEDHLSSPPPARPKVAGKRAEPKPA